MTAASNQSLFASGSCKPNPTTVSDWTSDSNGSICWLESPGRVIEGCAEVEGQGIAARALERRRRRRALERRRVLGLREARVLLVDRDAHDVSDGRDGRHGLYGALDARCGRLRRVRRASRPRASRGGLSFARELEFVERRKRGRIDAARVQNRSKFNLAGGTRCGGVERPSRPSETFWRGLEEARARFACAGRHLLYLAYALRDARRGDETD